MSLASTYQSLKNSLASKLTSKGVTASGTEGLTTLIGKIDDIKFVDNGIFLSADKNIGQTGDTIKLSAMMMSNGNFQPNKTIIFKDSNSSSETIEVSGDIDKDLGTSGNVFCGADLQLNFIDEDEIYWFNYNTGNGIGTLFEKSSLDTLGSFSGGNHLISFKNGVFSSNGHSLDVSSYFTSTIFSTVSGTLLESVLVYYDILGYDVTGTNGVASMQYTCVGAGKLEIVAEGYL